MNDIVLLCNVCNRPARNWCKLCGKMVCGEHYDTEAGICLSCKRGRIAAQK